MKKEKKSEQRKEWMSVKMKKKDVKLERERKKGSSKMKEKK